jgi:hypothetical protein
MTQDKGYVIAITDVAAGLYRLAGTGPGSTCPRSHKPLSCSANGFGSISFLDFRKWSPERFIREAGMFGELYETRVPNDENGESSNSSQGLKNSEVAEAMGTTEGVVKNYLRIISARQKDALQGRNPINSDERQAIEDARHNLYFLKKHPAA